jgi:ferredoxin
MTPRRACRNPRPRSVRLKRHERTISMSRVTFLCDADRCIECNACATACKNEHELPWGINCGRVVTINDGKPSERSVSMACMHCTDAPVRQFARCRVSTPRQTASFFTRRTSASVVDIASTRARSAHRSIQRSETSAPAARWTNARTAQADRKPTTRQLNMRIRL